jgi:hypothetical protein
MNGFQAECWRDLDKNKTIRRKQLAPIAQIIRYGRGFLSDKQISMLLKGRLNLLGNALYSKIYQTGISPSCPSLTCEKDEWTSHIFSGCLRHGRTTRHNDVQDIIVKAIGKTCHDDLIVDKAILRREGDKRRPDITYAKLKDTNKIQIGEITCPFDSNIQAKRELKKKKYEGDWIPLLEESKGSQSLSTELPNLKSTDQIQPDLAVFAVGALGTLDSEFYTHLGRYNVTGSTATNIGTEVAIASIRGSCRIWAQRCHEKLHVIPRIMEYYKM